MLTLIDEKFRLLFRGFPAILFGTILVAIPIYLDVNTLEDIVRPAIDTMKIDGMLFIGAVLMFVSGLSSFFLCVMPEYNLVREQFVTLSLRSMASGYKTIFQISFSIWIVCLPWGYIHDNYTTLFPTAFFSMIMFFVGYGDKIILNCCGDRSLSDHVLGFVYTLVGAGYVIGFIL